jgi:hypothetical protein
MPLRIVDEFKESTFSALRQASLISAVALALFITAGFLCAAAFIVVLENYGPVAACLAGAAISLVVAAIAGTIYAVRKRRIAARARQRANTMTRNFADPVVIATGLQIARAVGVKRLIPLIAIGGVALGFLASRGAAKDEAPAE